MKDVTLIVGLVLFVGLACRSGAQNVNIPQLSYGGEVLPPYRPPTTSTTTTTTTETPTTKKSGFFGGIKNWFSKTPTTEAPESTTTTTTTTPRPRVSVATTTKSPRVSSNVPNQPMGASSPQAPSGQRDYVASVQPKPSTPSGVPQTPTPGSPTISTQSPSSRRDYLNPNQPTSSSNIPQTPTTSSPSTLTQTSPSNRRDYVNPNIRPGSPNVARPEWPALGPQSPTPSSQPGLVTPSTTSGRRDYVNPNVITSKPPNVKEDFPALPPPRRPSSGGGSGPTSLPSASDQPSAWNTRPGSPQQQPGSTTGTTPQSAWATRPTQPTPSSPNAKPTMVSFVPTTKPAAGRPGVSTPSQPQLATDDELTTLSENLLSKDVNNLNKYITVNLQGKTRSYESTDEAPNPLLEIDSKAFDVPTVAKMKLLYNNYELDSSVNEYVTPIEKKEENDFIDAVMATSVMRQAMIFLQEKGIVTPDQKTHRELLKTIWFSLYSRGGGRIGSSGFEHIFLSEIKNGTVSGLHNALYFNDEEKMGHVDYKGYLKKVDIGSKGSIVKYRFDFNGISKPVNAMFIGLSPELEMALYTVCFEVRADKECPISLNGNRINIPTYTFRYRGKRLIGSAFPEI